MLDEVQAVVSIPAKEESLLEVWQTKGTVGPEEESKVACPDCGQRPCSIVMDQTAPARSKTVATRLA